MKIINYYPARSPWATMWTAYDHKTVSSDMAAIASLHANTVRVIIQPYAVGWPTLTKSGLSEIRDIINSASSHGLYVMLTLFDLWGTYEDITDSKTWVNSVLGPYVNDARVALVEIQNELPIDRTGATPWAQTMLAYVRNKAPSIPTTVSLPGNATSAQIAELVKDFFPMYVDTIDLHLYGSVNQMATQLEALAADAPNAPVMIGEAGASTGPAHSSGGEQSQVSFYRQLRRLCASFGITYFAPWILNDIRGTDGADQNFGLRTIGGSWKPAASVISRMFASSVSSVRPTGDLVTDGSFASENTRPDANRSLGAWSLSASSGMASGGVTQVNDVSAGYLTGAYANSSGWPMIWQDCWIGGVRKLTLSAHIRLVGATGATVAGLGFFNGLQLISIANTALANNSISGWQKFSVTVTVPAGATSVQVGLKSSGNAGTSQFSDVTLYAAS